MTVSRSAQDLRIPDGSPLFNGLTREQLEMVKEHLRRKTFPAGTNLMTVEQPGEVVYIILDGTVKVHVEQAGGADVIISILGPGDVVGEMSLLDNAGRSANAVTIEQSALLWMDRRAFKDCLQAIPRLTYNLACVLAGRLRLAIEHIQALSALEVEARIARQILAFADRHGTATAGGDILIPIRLTQSDIASMVGASREHTNKVLVSYKERRYISVDGNYRITIHDRQALARRSQ